MKIEHCETYSNPNHTSVGEVTDAEILRVGRRFTVACLVKKYGGAGWECDSRGNGFGVGNNAEAAVRGSYYDDGGGPVLRTLRECRAELSELGLIRD